MARLFNGSDEYLQIDSSPVTAHPLTFCCWWYPTDDTVQSEFFFLGDKDGGTQWYALGSRLDGADFKARLRVASAGNLHNYVWDTSGNLSENTWHHVLARCTSITDQDLFRDGVKTDGNTGKDPLPGNFDRVSIARLGDATPSNYAAGGAAEAAIWNAALTDAEAISLAKGYSPLFVRPQNLRAYWPLIRDGDQDRTGDYDLTAFNTPGIASHPPQMKYPVPQLFIAPTAAAPSYALPMAIHHYRTRRAAQCG